MSHGAVVAREYGLPAVVGVPDATSRISTGDWVTVDGAAGSVVVEPLRRSHPGWGRIGRDTPRRHRVGVTFPQTTQLAPATEQQQQAADGGRDRADVVEAGPVGQVRAPRLDGAGCRGVEHGQRVVARHVVGHRQPDADQVRQRTGHHQPAARAARRDGHHREHDGQQRRPEQGDHEHRVRRGPVDLLHGSDPDRRRGAPETGHHEAGEREEHTRGQAGPQPGQQGQPADQGLTARSDGGGHRCT